MEHSWHTRPVTSPNATDPNAAQMTVYNHVFAYWMGLLQGQQIPRRSDLDPSKLEHALDHIFIAERVDTGKLRIRQAGTGLDEIFGTDLQGVMVTDLLDPASQAETAIAIETMLQMPATLELSLSLAPMPGHPPGSALMSLLPLRSDLGDLSRAFGCLVSFGTKRLSTQRFHLRDLELRTADVDNRRISKPAKDCHHAPPSARPQHSTPSNKYSRDSCRDSHPHQARPRDGRLRTSLRSLVRVHHTDASEGRRPVRVFPRRRGTTGCRLLVPQQQCQCRGD